jgi:hypothetical protein
LSVVSCQDENRAEEMVFSQIKEKNKSKMICKSRVSLNITAKIDGMAFGYRLLCLRRQPPSGKFIPHQRIGYQIRKKIMCLQLRFPRFCGANLPQNESLACF